MTAPQIAAKPVRWTNRAPGTPAPAIRRRMPLTVAQLSRRAQIRAALSWSVTR